MKIKQVFRREMDNINCLNDFYDEYGNMIHIDLEKEFDSKYKKLVKKIANEIELYCEFKPQQENINSIRKYLKDLMVEWVEPVDMFSLEKTLEICKEIFPNCFSNITFKTICIISSTEWLTEDEKAFPIILSNKFNLNLF